MPARRMPIEIIWINDGFDPVSPGTRIPIIGTDHVTYGRNATARDEARDDPNESIQTWENPDAEPKDKRPNKTARLRGFATMDDRIAQAISRNR